MKNKDKSKGYCNYKSRTFEPIDIYKEYQRGIDYKKKINLFENAKKNENFFIGRQWEGVNAPDMDKPVFNIIKRVVNYFIANLVADKIGMNFSLINRIETDIEKIYMNAVRVQIESIIEQEKFSKKMRFIAKSAAVTGDGCMHVYFDPMAKTGRETERGRIMIEEIPATDVIFGNPMSPEVQTQRYIIFAVRKTIDDVYEELESMGRSEYIKYVAPDAADNPNTNEDDDNYNDKVTVLIKYWKRQGKVWMAKCTRNVWIKEPICIDLDSYPVCYMNWERQSNSMHGKGVVEEFIPNQIAINKMAAMAQQFIKQQAFPRIVYDKNRLQGGWQTGIKPIGTNGNPKDIVSYANTPTDMSAQVPQFFNEFITKTRDFMGASDAALGNVNPDNTSAIIAVQKAAAVPLELVKQEYYQFVESFVRICIEMMAGYYGKRVVIVEDDNGEKSEQIYNFNELKDKVLNFNIDIGTAAYWQEATDVQTLDNAFRAGIIDEVTYLESLPPHSLPNRSTILRKAKDKQEAAQAQAVETMPQITMERMK